jgi:hypothetical protein
MPEWLMGADCKSAGYAYAGSNPARPIHKSLKSAKLKASDVVFYFVLLMIDVFARVAQW